MKDWVRVQEKDRKQATSVGTSGLYELPGVVAVLSVFGSCAMLAPIGSEPLFHVKIRQGKAAL